MNQKLNFHAASQGPFGLLFLSLSFSPFLSFPSFNIFAFFQKVCLKNNPKMHTSIFEYEPNAKILYSIAEKLPCKEEPYGSVVSEILRYRETNKRWTYRQILCYFYIRIKAAPLSI